MLLWIHTLSLCLLTSPAHLCKIRIFKKMWMRIWIWMQTRNKLTNTMINTKTKMTKLTNREVKERGWGDKDKDKNDATHQLRGERERMGRQVRASGQE